MTAPAERPKVIPGGVPSDQLSESLLDFESRADNAPPSLIEGHLDPASANIIGGAPESCKTWLGLNFALAVASGRRLYGRYRVTQGSVVVWIEEGSRPKIASRVRRLRRGMDITDADAARLPVRFIILRGIRLDRRDDVARLRHELDEGERPDLFVVDNLRQIFAGDENAAHEVGRALAELTGIQAQYDCSIALLHHDRKNGTDRDAEASLRGSSAIDAWWRSRLLLSQSDRGISVRHRSKDGIAGSAYTLHIEDLEDGSARLVWDGPVVSAKETQLESALLAAIRKLGDEATQNNIVKETGKRKADVIAALQRLRERGVLITDECVVGTGQRALRWCLATGSARPL